MSQKVGQMPLIGPRSNLQKLGSYGDAKLLAKIGGKWTIFAILSFYLPGGRACFFELERSVPGISQMTVSVRI